MAIVKPSNKSSIHQCSCQTCQRHPSGSVAEEHCAINRVVAGFNEKYRRLFMGLLALQWGRGGTARLIEISGISRNTIHRGRVEIQCADRVTVGRVRLAGAGRPPNEKVRRGS